MAGQTNCEDGTAGAGKHKTLSLAGYAAVVAIRAGLTLAQAREHSFAQLLLLDASWARQRVIEIEDMQLAIASCFVDRKNRSPIDAALRMMRTQAGL